MKRAELVSALRESGAETLAAMTAVPADRLQTAGYENGWTVKQIMAHVASMEFTYRRLPDIARGSRDAQAQPSGGAFDMDGYNARQVERRAARTPAELADEFLRGRAALIADVEQLDEELLAREIRSAGGITGTLAEVFERTAGDHVRQHGGDFLRAAGVPPAVMEAKAAAVLLAAEEVAQKLEAASANSYLHRAGADDWPAAGIAGHVTELLPYWAQKLRAVSVDPTVSLTRSLDSPERIGAVVQGEKLSPAEAAAAVRAAARQAAGELRSIPAGAWQATIDHPRYGVMTIAGGVDQLMVRHAREHAAQIASALAGAG